MVSNITRCLIFEEFHEHLVCISGKRVICCESLLYKRGLCRNKRHKSSGSEGLFPAHTPSPPTPPPIKGFVSPTNHRISLHVILILIDQIPLINFRKYKSITATRAHAYPLLNQDFIFIYCTMVYIGPIIIYFI